MTFNTYGFFLVIMALLIASTSFAFKEQFSSPENTAKNIDDSSKSKKQLEPVMQFKVPETSSTKGEEGIELRIPGVGKIGTLPKLELGLELLYGGKNENAQDDKEDYRLKGSINRKF